MVFEVGPVPDGLAWAFGIAGAIALPVAIVALVPLAQMIWGGPKLALQFTRNDDASPALFIRILNPPIAGRRLRRLVRREAATGLGGSFTVYETETRKVVAGPIYPTFDRMDLPAEAVESFIVAIQIEGTAAIGANKGEARVMIKPGSYICRATVWAAHTQANGSKSFVLSDNGRLFWS